MSLACFILLITIIFIKLKERKKKKNFSNEWTQCSIKDERIDDIESERYTIMSTCKGTELDQNEIFIIPMSNGQDLSPTYDIDSDDNNSEPVLKLQQNSISLRDDETEINSQLEDPLSDVLDEELNEDERKSFKEMFAEESVLSIFESVNQKDGKSTPVFSTV